MAFLRSAWTVAGVRPDRITTDGHEAYARAVRTVFGAPVMRQTDCPLNNHLGQDHRGIKQRHLSDGSVPSFPLRPTAINHLPSSGDE